MARIRSVKPEFHTDRRLALDLTRDQRLFYQGMWNFADDEGRLVADPRGLLGEIFRYEKDLDEVWIEDLLVRLVLTHRAILYEVGGEQICQLSKFSKHQKISHPTPSKLAPPPKKMASPLGWLSRRYSGATLEALRPDVEVEVEVEQGTGNREREGVRAREGSATPEGQPPDFTPTEDHRARAAELGLDLDAELRKYLPQRRLRGIDPSDDDFTLWLERAPEFNRDKPPATGPTPLRMPNWTPTPAEPEAPFVPLTPEEIDRRKALMDEALGRDPFKANGGRKPARAPPSAAVPDVIDDPDVIAAREAERERQLARVREGKP